MIFLFRIGYRILMKLGIILMPLFCKFNKKIKKRLEVQKNQNLPTLASSIVFHAASLGEYEQAIPIIQAFAKRSNLPIVVSFFSASGYQYAIKSPLLEVTCYTYLPWDTPSKINPWLEKLNPKKVILIKYELWYEFMRISLSKKIELYLFAGVFYEQHFLSKPLGKPYLKLLCQFQKITVQNEFSVQFLTNLKVPQVSLELDPRYDRVSQQLQNEPEKIASLKTAIPRDKSIVVLGSVWMSDIEKLREEIIHLAKTHRLLIAPHDISEKNIKNMTDYLGLKSSFYSNWEEGKPMEKVFWIDAIGGLKYVYQIADFSYIGGGFHKAGIHNVLESLIYGVPVIVGNRHHKFPEISFLAQRKAVFIVSNPSEFREKTQEITIHLEQIKANTKRLMQSQLGGGVTHAKYLV